jgi:tetratricopeptide (TPR) repeat protein
MKQLVRMLMATSLLLGAAPFARTEAPPNVATTDKLADARMAEAKGDMARLHNDYPLAATYYQQALRVENQNAELNNKLGVAELKTGNKGSARKYFSRAVHYNPQFATALNNLGAVDCLDQKYKPAVSYLKQALALDETQAATHINLAEAWIGLGDTDRAMTEYTRALELDPDALSENENGVLARVSTPEQRARTAYILARTYAKRGNLEGALDYLQRAKEGHYPDLAKVYSDPEFAPLWKDPRLAKIVKR